MTIEQKAKAYDEAIERAKDMINRLEKGENILLKADLKLMFPQLKESEDEDERIRKELINTINLAYDCGIAITIGNRDKYLAWLEKQGQKETTWNKEDEENMNNVLYIFNQLKDTSSYKEDDIAEKTINWLKSLKDRLCSNNEYDKDMLGAIEYCIKNNRPFEKEHIDWLEKQGETSPILSNSSNIGKNEDKVEPKFKAGDWVVLYPSEIEANRKIVQISRVERCQLNMYWTTEGTWFGDGTDARLWTIEDAKDGDVLVHNGRTFIFMGIKDGLVQAIEDIMHALVPFGEPDKDKDYYPATKEQRDLLFQKMKEAGHEWDAEKKKMKR